MNLLEEVRYDDYKQRIEYAYYLTLIDILMGITIQEILSEVPEYEDKEMYEYCEGIKRAIDFSEDKNYSDIQTEILKLKDRYE